MSAKSPLLIPNVTNIPGQNKILTPEERAGWVKKAPGEFDAMLNRMSDQPADLNHVKAPIKLSQHATQRINERKISMDPSMWSRVSQAMDQAEAKGLDDTLVLTGDAAFIVSVKNRTIVTALDKNSMQGNVFTNIDGAVIV